MLPESLSYSSGMIQKMALNHLGLRGRSAAGGHLHSATPESNKSHWIHFEQKPNVIKLCNKQQRLNKHPRNSKPAEITRNAMSDATVFNNEQLADQSTMMTMSDAAVKMPQGNFTKSECNGVEEHNGSTES